MRKQKYNLKKPTTSRFFLYIITLLSILGLLVLFDASAPLALNRFGDKFLFVRQQALFYCVGFAGMLIVSKINYKYFEKYAVFLFAFTVFLLILVLIPGIGNKALGARRWIDLGFFSLQPSELAKLTISIYLAKVASKNKTLFSYLIPLGLTLLLIILEPDLGTAIIVALIALVQIFISGINLFYFGGISLFGVISALLLILFSPYRRERLLTYFEMSRDPLGASYHIRQVLYSLGMGGVWGVGLGRSRQKYLYLPEVATDSIFAVVAEESGFLGSMVVILLFALLIFTGIKIVKAAPDTFSKILSGGIIAWIGGQAFLNFSSMLAIFPLTGVPLPFFSYGGSSLLTIFIGLGILLNISKHGKQI